ncbi:hypothetical protein BZA77DRAFT_72367 [Pyronema omphalodes]|nr:hypothetical protein BZA77DRAFT_72367 [Pyronema omphalodes]
MTLHMNPTSALKRFKRFVSKVSSKKQARDSPPTYSEVINEKHSNDPYTTTAANEKTENLHHSKSQRRDTGSGTRKDYASQPRANQGQDLRDKNLDVNHPITRERWDPYGALKIFDNVLLLDDSASMAEQDNGIGLSRWEQLENVLSYVVPVVTKYDDDGVDVYFLNQTFKDKSNVRTSDEVMDLFREARPCQGTPIGTRIKMILENYLAEYENHLELERKGKASALKPMKPMNVICITDGAPWPYERQKAILYEAIVTTARRMKELEKKSEKLSKGKSNGPKLRQLGVQFVQVGSDRGAAAFLKKLDEDLEKQGVPDIVDTFNYDQMSKETGLNCLTGEDLLKVVLGAIDKSVDIAGEEDMW